MVEDYLLARRLEIQNQLNYRYINRNGKDISDVLRGKLEMLDMFLNMKEVFTNFDKLKEAVDAHGNDVKGAK